MSGASGLQEPNMADETKQQYNGGFSFHHGAQVIANLTGVKGYERKNERGRGEGIFLEITNYYTF